MPPSRLSFRICKTRKHSRGLSQAAKISSGPEHKERCHGSSFKRFLLFFQPAAVSTVVTACRLVPHSHWCLTSILKMKFSVAYPFPMWHWWNLGSRFAFDFAAHILALAQSRFALTNGIIIHANWYVCAYRPVAGTKICKYKCCKQNLSCKLWRLDQNLPPDKTTFYCIW